MVNGGTAAMEILACNLFDPDDVIITPSPCYTRIFNNFNERFKVEAIDLLLREKGGKVKVYEFSFLYILNLKLVLFIR